MKLMGEGRSPYGIRLSTQNFSRSDNGAGVELRALPLYVAFTIA